MLWIWLIMIVLFVVIEAVSEQFISIWFAVGAVGGLVASAFNAPVLAQWIVFVLLSLISLLATRPFVRKFRQFDVEKTNADRYVGEEGMVIEEINNTLAQGQVKVGGSIWSARSSDETVIPLGSMVCVEKIEGVKLLVQKI